MAGFSGLIGYRSSPSRGEREEQGKGKGMGKDRTRRGGKGERKEEGKRIEQKANKNFDNTH